MYAVIETGGKQHRVEVGSELEVESLDVELGKTVTIERVLLVADGDEASIGRPVVEGAAVSAEVVRQTRGEKVIVFKYRPKARRRVKKGHRQELTILRVSDIVLNGKSAAKEVAASESDAQIERKRLEAAAVAQAAKDAELAAKLAEAAKKPTAGTTTRRSTAKPAPSRSATTKAETTKAEATTADTTKAETTKAETTKAATDAATPKKTTTRGTATAAGASAPKPAAAKPAAKPATAKPAAQKAAAAKPAAEKPAPKPRAAAKPRATKEDE